MAEEASTSVSDAIAAAAAIGSGSTGEDGTPVPATQTRFQFYEPQELFNENDNNSSNKDESGSQKGEDDKRYSFYDEATRQELAEVENNLPSAIKPKKAAPPAIHTSSMAPPPSDTTDDILRSLQETEEQRLQILKGEPSRTSGTSSVANPVAASGNNENNDANPYEDAIKEALDLLRKHRSPPGTPSVELAPQGAGIAINPNLGDSDRPRTPREHDRLLQHRMDDDDEDMVVVTPTIDVPSSSAEPANQPSSPAVVEDLTDVYEEHKLKAKQRQERMAQYASRLEEFKSSLPSETVEQHWPPVAPTGSNLERLADEHAQLAPAASHNEDSVGFSDLSHSTKEQVEAEVQRGVERVLLAILERANASRGRAGSSIGSVGSAGKQYQHPDTSMDATTGSSVGDALLRAMDEMRLGNASGSIQHTSTMDSGSAIRTKTSGESEVTGMGSKRSATSVVDELLAEDDSTFMGMAADDDDDGDHHEKASTLSMTSPAATAATHYGQSWGPREEKKLPDSQEKYDTIDEGNEECDHRTEEEFEDESQNDNHSHTLAGVLGPLSKKAGGTTGVVLDIDHNDDDHDKEADDRPGHAIGYAASPSSTAVAKGGEQYHSRYQSSGDKYATVDTDDEADADGDSDVEATELMRTLCAHLLPFGVDRKSNRLLDAIPDWDENNPNEAGYRIIRLSKSQLRRVERSFETMINGLKLNSERELNGVEESGDAKFARELREAERLLDESEENQLKAAEMAVANDRRKAEAMASEAIAGKKTADPTVEDEDEDGHPSFPGVKCTGKGEMGDLEYFHLPIIFKSHVTGFEPTKDLVLEPGNVVAGQYLVESELGSAAFSTAYRCIDLSSENNEGHEEVCLKVIKNTKDFFDQSLDEIKILELLRQTGQVHENHIVEMKCFFYYREHLVIVTELLRQNLFEFGKFILDNNEEPYFTIPRLAYLTRQALIALRFVHNLGLVHSDVKPENILLSSYSRAQIKVIDFGSSCYLTDRQSSYIQSRSYRAPEVVLGLPYDGKIDVWSLGCVVAEMYTGEVTFQNDSIVSMLSRIEAICGPFPRHMIAQGRQSGRFFTKSGLLFEVVEDAERGDGNKTAPGPHDDDEDESDNLTQFDIFQPKNTRFCARLGFDVDFMEDTSDPERQQEQMFIDFVRRLLTIDPDGRPTADEALKHPWMLYAASLTEEHVKYPSS